jgi:hypothetical protein
MTNFEKEIDSKRGMSRKKFEEILKQHYGEGKYLYNKTYTYGDVSSFLTWNRDENNKDKIKILDKKLYKNILTQRADQINNGDIYNWDQKKLEVITTKIVFVGLNMSADGKPLTSKYKGTLPEDFWFQNARRHEAIIRTFAGTKAEGAYFTDIIKPDKRIHDALKKIDKKNADSSAVMKIIRDKRCILEDHLRLFNEELDLIVADKPLLIVFGNGAEWCLKQGFKKNKQNESILDESRFHDDVKVKIYHYAYYSRLEGRFEEYRDKVREQISTYITIPEKNSVID